MKAKLLTLIMLLVSLVTLAQPNTTWGKWAWLIGEWNGEGSGKPGHGIATFSFKADLKGKVMVFKSHSEFQAPGKPVTVNEGLMIIYTGRTDKPVKAVYFDNEGKIVNYSIAYESNAIVMTSEKIPNAPTLRLTYTLLGKGIVGTKFQISQNGTDYQTYVEGKSKKVK